MQRKLKKLVWFGAGFALFGVFFWYKERAAVAAGQPSSWEALTKANPWTLVVGLLLMIVSQLPLLGMWVYLCRRAGIGRPFHELYRMFAVILFLGPNTPGRSGEMALPLMDRENFGRLTSVVVVNRVFGILFTAGLALFFMAVCMSAKIVPGRQGYLVILLVAILLGIVFTALNRRVLTSLVGRLFAVLGWFESIGPVARIVALKPRVDEEIDKFYAAIRNMIHWRGVVLVFLLQVAAYAFVLLANWMVLRSLGVDRASPITVLGVMAAMSLSGLVALTPGGMGVGEWIGEGVFKLYQIRVPAAYYALIRLMMQLGLPAFYLSTAWLVKKAAGGRTAEPAEESGGVKTEAPATPDANPR